MTNMLRYTTKLISFESEKHIKIYGKLYLPIQQARLGLILYHGGKAASSKQFNFLQPALANNGIASLAIDFRGRGRSSGVYEKSTLDDRLVDAKASFDFFTKCLETTQIGILGVSLAGDTVRLLQEVPNIKMIVLIGPVTASPNLTTISPPHKAHGISRKTNIWKNSTVFPLLSNFSGPKLVIYGEKEDIAILEMIEAFKKAALASGQFVLLKNAGHNPFIVDKKATKKIRLDQIRVRQETIDIITQFAKEHL